MGQPTGTPPAACAAVLVVATLLTAISCRATPTEQSAGSAGAPTAVAPAVPPATESIQVVWVNRAGERLGTLDGAAQYRELALAPDDNRVAVSALDPSRTGDIWLIDLKLGTRVPFTSNPTHEAYPLWSPDGRRVLYVARRAGVDDFYAKDAAGDGTEEQFGKFDIDHNHPSAWSSDGRFVIFEAESRTTNWDIWMLSVTGRREPVALRRETFNERHGQLSPDGRWLAYSSDESGRLEVYVQRFRGTERTQVSNGGGSHPRWRRDGAELFYVGLDRILMAVPITAGAKVQPGAPMPLFQMRTPGDSDDSSYQYAVASNGQRFVMLQVQGP